MEHTEALLIKQWDSAGVFARSEGRARDTPGESCTMSLHSAFNDKSAAPDAPNRQSIEVRCLVLFDPLQSKV